MMRFVSHFLSCPAVCSFKASFLAGIEVDYNENCHRWPGIRHLKVQTSSIDFQIKKRLPAREGASDEN